MKWYKHQIDDYWDEIYGLPDAEDLAYRRLKDLYYVKEAPLPANEAWLTQHVNLTWDCIEPVLVKFFRRQDAEWLHSEWQSDINTRLQVRENNRKAGRIGGKNKKGLRKKPDAV
jgi:uncharacterized protein YdaU (DUF1376 family)